MNMHPFSFLTSSSSWTPNLLASHIMSSLILAATLHFCMHFCHASSRSHIHHPLVFLSVHVWLALHTAFSLFAITLPHRSLSDSISLSFTFLSHHFHPVIHTHSLVSPLQLSTLYLLLSRVSLKPHTLCSFKPFAFSLMLPLSRSFTTHLTRSLLVMRGGSAFHVCL